MIIWIVARKLSGNIYNISVSRDHICPTELEFANLEDYDSDLVQFLEAVSSTEKNAYSIQWMMMCYDKLAGRRQE